VKEILTFDKSFWIALTIFIIVIACICFLPFWLTKPGLQDFTNTGEIGDTIGGIMGPFVAIGVGVLTFFAFWVQFKANEQQKSYLRKQSKEFKFERLETRLFEMIKWHRDNVSELIYANYSFRRNTKGEFVPKEIVHTSKKVFNLIFEEFEKLYNEINPFFPINSDEIYNKEYKSSLLKNKLFLNRNINLIERAKIDIVYTMLFFGLSREGINSIKHFFKNRYQTEICEFIILAAQIKPSPISVYWERWQNFIKLSFEDRMQVISDWNYIFQRGDIYLGEEASSKSFLFKDLFRSNFVKFYGGHQFRLAHYFTHLFHIVAYIHNSKILTSNSKKEYIKLLRAQLSTYEQIIFFLNTVSGLGKAWELETNEDSSIPVAGELITTYKLIKNIPGDVIMGDIKVSDFYPDWRNI